MALRNPRRLAAMACMGLSAVLAVNGIAQAAPPSIAAVADSPDQRLAEAIAQKLSATTHITGYQVEVICDSGTVELAGKVKDAQQAAELIKVVRSVRGVVKVIDRTAAARITPVQNLEPLPTPSAMPSANGRMTSVPSIASQMPVGNGNVVHGEGCPQGGCPQGGSPPMMNGHGGPVGDSGPSGGYDGSSGYDGSYGGFGPVYGGAGDPTPLGTPPTGGLYDSTPPKMPPYAWPTYAPHNNYSRVAYPQAYPANAFPFIGPFYPFPKVPPGYRSIKLEWEDGAWYYGRKAVKRDWWKIRYW